MTQTILVKRSAVAGKAPAIGDLQLGEIAINTYDGKLYTKKNDGTTSIIEIGGNPFPSQAGYANSVLKTNGNGVYWANAGGTITKISQTNHGFSVGQAVKFNGSQYVLAQANVVSNSYVVGLIATVPDTNTFELVTSGIVTLSGTNFIPGSVYYLSPNVAGSLTTTEPTTVGQVSKPLFIATGTNTGLFYNWKGTIVAAPATGQVSATSGNLLQLRSDGLYYGIQAPVDTATLYVDAINGSDANVGNDPNLPLQTIAAAASKGTAGTERFIMIKEGQTHYVYGTAPVYLNGGLVSIKPYGPLSSALPPQPGDEPLGSLAGLNLNTRIVMVPNATNIDATGTKWLYGRCFWPSNSANVRFVAVTIDIDTTQMNQYLANGYHWQLDNCAMLGLYTDAKYEFHASKLVLRDGIDYFGSLALNNSTVFLSGCSIVQSDANAYIHTCPTAGANILFNDWGYGTDGTQRDLKTFIRNEQLSCATYTNLLITTAIPNPTNLGTRNTTFMTLTIGNMETMLNGQTVMINPNDTGNDANCMPSALVGKFLYLAKINSRDGGNNGGSYIITNFNDPTHSYLGVSLGNGSLPTWAKIGNDTTSTSSPIVDMMLGDEIVCGNNNSYNYLLDRAPSGYVVTGELDTSNNIPSFYARPLLVKLQNNSTWYIVRQSAYNSSYSAYNFSTNFSPDPQFRGPTLSAA